jgi:hypothetical protein
MSPLPGQASLWRNQTYQGSGSLRHARHTMPLPPQAPDEPTLLATTLVACRAFRSGSSKMRVRRLVSTGICWAFRRSILSVGCSSEGMTHYPSLLSTPSPRPSYPWSGGGKPQHGVRPNPGRLLGHDLPLGENLGKRLTVRAPRVHNVTVAPILLISCC